jgi:hypothetical protein
MAIKVPQKNSFVKSGNEEYLKQYLVYDGSNRITQIYEAMANALNGDPCLLTEYGYVGISSRVEKMRESESTWDSSWELP